MPYPKSTPLPLCRDCGEPLSNPKARQCRDCYIEAAMESRPRCVDCGQVLTKRGAKSDGTVRCRPCWLKMHMAQDSRPKCVDCGKPVSWQVGLGEAKQKAKRCWDCEVKRRHESRYTVPLELGRRVALRSDTKQDSQKVRNGRSVGRPLRAILSTLPCTICQYSGLPSRIHRIVPRRGYTIGNVAPVCSRCHDEIHAGVTPQPLPITADQFKVLFSSAGN